jgi:hypothetical protein
MICAIAISGLLAGCAGQRRAAVPGCQAPVYVPEGCYTQTFPDRIEVRCPDRTWTYRCIKETK